MAQPGGEGSAFRKGNVLKAADRVILGNCHEAAENAGFKYFLFW